MTQESFIMCISRYLGTMELRKESLSGQPGFETITLQSENISSSTSLNIRHIEKTFSVKVADLNQMYTLRYVYILYTVSRSEETESA
jgi:hypothetical protein